MRIGGAVPAILATGRRAREALYRTLVRWSPGRLPYESRLKEGTMKNASLALALLIAALGVGGCSYYFRVTDTSNGRVYYTRD